MFQFWLLLAVIVNCSLGIPVKSDQDRSIAESDDAVKIRAKRWGGGYYGNYGGYGYGGGGPPVIIHKTVIVNNGPPGGYGYGGGWGWGGGWCGRRCMWRRQMMMMGGGGGPWGPWGPWGWRK